MILGLPPCTEDGLGGLLPVVSDRSVLLFVWGITTAAWATELSRSTLFFSKTTLVLILLVGLWTFSKAQTLMFCHGLPGFKSYRWRVGYDGEYRRLSLSLTAIKLETIIHVFFEHFKNAQSYEKNFFFTYFLSKKKSGQFV